MTGAILVSIHDVAPSSFTTSRSLLDRVERSGLVATLLVVAGPWNGQRADEDDVFGSWLRGAAQRGHEVALHGWEHRRIDDTDGPCSFGRRAVGTIAARGCDEFWLLGQREARRRLRRSIDVLHRIGVTPTGFTPPGWLASPGTIRAAADVGLHYRTSHLGIHDLRHDRHVYAPALSSRPGSRLTQPAAVLMERLAHKQLHLGATVRLACHPDDLSDPRIDAALSNVLATAQRLGATPRTYQQALARSFVRKRTTRSLSVLHSS